MQKETPSNPSALRRWLASVIADRRFHGVLLVWALSSAILFLCVARFGGPFPWADEWGLTSVASGQEPLSWSWLWVANNEHRLPLMRLGLYALGQLSHWDWQAMHYTTLTLMSLGALALLFAARAIRGYSALSDTFLCLVVLSPGHYETIWLYAYSFGAPGGLICIALSLAAVRWPERSQKHLILYLLTVLAITLAGGPPGNLMALGLLGALVPCFLETTSRTWKRLAIVGSGLVLVPTGLLLALTPSPHNANYISNSLLTTLKATAKESVCWLGPPVLQVLWPWVFLIVLLPSLWVVGRIAHDLLRWRRGNQTIAREWLDLSMVWLAAVLVAACIAYGRARYALWAPRYMALTMPIGIVLYLLLVRMRAPLAIPQTLAVIVAIFCGWNWSAVLPHQQVHGERTAEFVRMLARGDVPLSEVCKRYCAVVGPPPDSFWTARVTNWMMELRQSDQSIFHRINRRKQRAGLPLPQAWEAESGKLGEGWLSLRDESATQDQALRVTAEGTQPAVAVYHVQVAVGGVYQLCCRMRAPRQQTLSIRVDESQALQQTFPANAEFQPCVLAVPLKLEPGQHDLTLALSPANSDLDLLELVPQSPAQARSTLQALDSARQLVRFTIQLLDMARRMVGAG